MTFIHNNAERQNTALRYLYLDGDNFPFKEGDSIKDTIFVRALPSHLFKLVALRHIPGMEDLCLSKVFPHFLHAFVFLILIKRFTAVDYPAGQQFNNSVGCALHNLVIPR